MAKPLLTISIPTYNRPKQLQNTLQQLLPQVNNNCQVLILDNHSEIPVVESVKYIFQQYSEVNYKIIRNRVNVGADVNFMRCFENCETPYIWTLSDDDVIKINAIENIFAELNDPKNAKVTWFNFVSSTYGQRKQSYIVKNVVDLFNKLDNFSNLLLLSTNVYHTNSYLQYLHFSARGAYSMSSQLIPSLIGVANNGEMKFSKKPIVSNDDVDLANSWSQAQFYLNLSSILEFPFAIKENEFKAIGKKLYEHAESFPRLLCDILKSINLNTNMIDSYHIYIFTKTYKTTILFRKNRMYQNVLYILCYILLKCPFIINVLLLNTKLRQKINDSSNFEIFKRDSIRVFP